MSGDRTQPSVRSPSETTDLTFINHLNHQTQMSKINLTGWKLVIKVIVALATALLGVLGAQELGGNEA